MYYKCTYIEIEGREAVRQEEKYTYERFKIGTTYDNKYAPVEATLIPSKAKIVLQQIKKFCAFWQIIFMIDGKRVQLGGTDHVQRVAAATSQAT